MSEVEIRHAARATSEAQFEFRAESMKETRVMPINRRVIIVCIGEAEGWPQLYLPGKRRSANENLPEKEEGNKVTIIHDHR